MIRQGDMVIHLRGIPPNANFVGYSVASGDGFETSRRPQAANEWGYTSTFYRADLSQYTPFYRPINLSDLIAGRKQELERYHDDNNALGVRKRNVFIVRQSGRLQCLNGAYLSDADDALLIALFGDGGEVRFGASGRMLVSIETGSQIRTILARIGQVKFASAVKAMYGNRCCFPGCTVNDSRFLVGAHIARWSDSEALRGHLGNGMCLCLVHDKAFEIGIFTLDANRCIFINPRERKSGSEIARRLVKYHGERIATAEVPPLDDALLEHWIRVGIEP